MRAFGHGASAQAGRAGTAPRAKQTATWRSSWRLFKTTSTPKAISVLTLFDRLLFSVWLSPRPPSLRRSVRFAGPIPDFRNLQSKWRPFLDLKVQPLADGPDIKEHRE